MKLDLTKPKSSEEYSRFLENMSRNTLQKFDDFINVFEEAIELTPTDFYPDVFISKEELAKKNLTLSDAKSIAYMFAEDMAYTLLPTQRSHGEIKDDDSGFSILAEDLRENDIPYGENLEHFKAAVRNVCSTKKEINTEKNSKNIPENEEILKLAPEFYGIGINLRSVWKRLRSFWAKRKS